MAYTTQQLQQMIATEAQAQGVDPALALAVAQHESSFNPNAYIAKDGSAGLFQLEPATAAEVGVTNALDPVQNIEGGIAYLKKMLTDNNGDVTAALEAYNGGERHVEQGTVSTAAQTYASVVQGLMPKYQSLLAALGFSPALASSSDMPSGDAGGGSISFDTSAVDAGVIALPSFDLSSVPSYVWVGAGLLAAWGVIDFLFGRR